MKALSPTILKLWPISIIFADKKDKVKTICPPDLSMQGEIKKIFLPFFFNATWLKQSGPSTTACSS